VDRIDDTLVLPYLTADLPGIGGVIRSTPEDFEVEEIPAYEPCGQGDHLFLWIEKRGMGTEFLIQELAKQLAISANDVGMAGQKDRHAVTRQMISIPASAESRVSALSLNDFRVLRVARHTNKLRLGHLHGNRFNVLIRDAVQDQEAVQAIAAKIQALGLPNFYGEQRFGRDGATLEAGLQLLRGERLARRPSHYFRKLALSSVQSWLFNRYLIDRMADGKMRTVLQGDVLAKWPAGGMFVSTQPVVDQPRLDSREVVPAGPMFGLKMFPAATEAAERESAILQSAGLTIESFRGFGKLLQGTRRHNFVYVDGLRAGWETHGLRLEFSLPAGSYATVLLREFMKKDQAASNEFPS